MKVRATFLLLAAVLLAVLIAGAVAGQREKCGRPPNVVLIFTDDQGYGDLGCYGARRFRTPNIDRLAREGVRFTDFYAAQAVCSASRAALLTGCYSNRVGILGALGPASRIGINAEETTLAEVVKQQGYATAIYGKWHLGHLPPFLPTRHGFDEYFGLPYSNDMWPKHPTNSAAYPPLPLMEGERILGHNPDQTQLTTWYAEHAVRFIDRNRDRPFLLYLAHNMPHVPLHVSEKYRGKSEQGPYGDVIEEVDWSVGQVMEALRRNGLERDTLVLFTCDNGPWLSYGNHAGSAGALREGKATAFEGGVREPFIARWPGHIPAGMVCREPAMTIDVLPTVARLTGASLPKNRIDGKDIWPLMAGAPGARSPHEAFYYYWGRELHAVRSGRWKLHLPHDYPHLDGPPGSGGRPNPYTKHHIATALFDLQADPGETTDLAEKQPEVVRRLQALAEAARADLGDALTMREGKNVRPPGRVE